MFVVTKENYSVKVKDKNRTQHLRMQGPQHWQSQFLASLILPARGEEAHDFGRSLQDKEARRVGN